MGALGAQEIVSVGALGGSPFGTELVLGMRPLIKVKVGLLESSHQMQETGHCMGHSAGYRIYCREGAKNRMHQLSTEEANLHFVLSSVSEDL